MAKDEDQPKVDKASEAVADAPTDDDEFVLRNRYSPQREALMREYRRSLRDPANEAMSSPSLSTGSPNMPVGEDQVPSGFDVESMTVTELDDFARDNPALVDAILEAEQARDQPRKGVVEAMERHQAAAGAEGTAEG